MNAQYTDATILLDRSASMSELVAAVVAGFNQFLETQRKTAIKTHAHVELGLIQFDDDYQAGPRAEVNDHPLLTVDQFTPRGHTALFDALGKAIDDTGKRLAALPENERPGKVIFVILTDGNDDASRYFSQQDIREKISLQSHAYKWDFVYLGANQDAWAVGSQLGIQPGKTLATQATGPGTDQGFKVAAAYVAKTLIAPDADAALEQKFSEADALRVRRAGNSYSQSQHA